MKITSIEQAKGSRYTVYVDGEYWFILDEEIILTNGIREGLECDEAFLADVRVQAERRKARERAFYLLEYRDYTRKELVDKLKRSVSEQIAEETADRMEELGYLNEEEYARRFAAVLLEQKLMGRRAALFRMEQKGIPRELAEQTIRLVHIDPADQIRTLIERRYAKDLTDRKGIQKVTGALARLGHEYSDIRDVIREYTSDDGMTD